ncbi:unnamed protein product [Ranitomeya imitator]|uniref:Monocyte differentiation antigen CD14 n=1 Tax=Ranitomeya imitator TaxID=111125 RepID=A0ABN9LCV4_9NEOB|nr:unnamed protein product [Ranitomeya imitator]
MKMKIYYSLFLTLLFAQKVHGDCLYDKYLRHCSCSLLELNNIMSILPCAAATSFEFNGGTFINTEDFSLIDIKVVWEIAGVSLTKISFVNVVLSEDFLAAFISVIFQVPVDLLLFENTTFVGQSVGFNLMESPPHILALQFINVSSNPLIQRDTAFYRFGNWMSILKNLTVKESLLRGVPCDIALLFQSLSTLDLSDNLFSDHNVSSMFCNGAYPNLQTLKLRSSNFSNYEILCQALSRYDQLRYLDLSLNDFSKMSNSLCEWQPSLSHLNLSNTGLEQESISLPPNCEDGNQGKHRVTKCGPALSYPMFTLVTSEDIAESPWDRKLTLAMERSQERPEVRERRRMDGNQERNAHTEYYLRPKSEGLQVD